MKRREFLKTGFLVSAVPAIIRASAMGRNGHTAPSDRIVMGCIGLGGQGTYNLKAFLNKQGTQVVALCDVNKGTGSYPFPQLKLAKIYTARNRW